MSGPTLIAASSSPWIFSLLALACAMLGLYAGRLIYRPRRLPTVQAGTAPEVASDDEGGWADRRAHARHRVRQLKVLISDAQAQATPIEGWLLNRSLGGLGLSVSRAIESGNIVSVKPCNDDPHAPWVQVEVRYCRLERGRWTLGCKFVDESPHHSQAFG